MILPFFKKKTYPSFWKKYIKHFEQPVSKEISKIRFVVFDTETTGINVNKDRVLSIGAILIKDNTIKVKDTLEIYVKQEVFNPDTVQIHGILQNSKFDKLSELAAIELFLHFIKNAVLVGHHVNFDVTMINQILKRNGLTVLKNKTLDTGFLFLKTKVTSYLLRNVQKYSLDDICDELAIDKKNRHTALGDAYITAVAFLKIMGRLGPVKPITLRQLIRKNNFY